jgi:hypothetical protein
MVGWCWLHKDNGKNCWEIIYLLQIIFVKKILLPVNTNTMKKTLVLIFLLIHVIAFAQDKKTVQSGYITFNSNSTFDFKNLTIDGQNVSYYNEVTKTQMKFPLNSVKKIVDNYGTTVYQMADKVLKKGHAEEVAVQTQALKKTDEEKLIYKASDKILLNGERQSSKNLKLLLKTDPSVYDTYKSGVNNATFGSILIGSGIGMFIGGAITNLSSANSGSGGGSPAFLIAGVVVSAIGIPVRIGGVRKIKEAVYGYNSLPPKRVSLLQQSEFKVIAGTNGVGLLWQL